jgi:hypothetical protein
MGTSDTTRSQKEQSASEAVEQAANLIPTVSASDAAPEVLPQTAVPFAFPIPPTEPSALAAAAVAITAGPKQEDSGKPESKAREEVIDEMVLNLKKVWHEGDLNGFARGDAILALESAILLTENRPLYWGMTYDILVGGTTNEKGRKPALRLESLSIFKLLDHWGYDRSTMYESRNVAKLFPPGVRDENETFTLHAETLRICTKIIQRGYKEGSSVKTEDYSDAKALKLVIEAKAKAKAEKSPFGRDQIVATVVDALVKPEYRNKLKGIKDPPPPPPPPKPEQSAEQTANAPAASESAPVGANAAADHSSEVQPLSGSPAGATDESEATGEASLSNLWINASHDVRGVLHLISAPSLKEAKRLGGRRFAKTFMPFAGLKTGLYRVVLVDPKSGQPLNYINGEPMESELTSIIPPPTAEPPADPK